MRLICKVLWGLVSVFGIAQLSAQTVVFHQAGFPAVDTAGFSAKELEACGPTATMVGVTDLPKALAEAQLLVMPYGSAFPEADWPAIRSFLRRGGNLLTVGGRPFTRSIYRVGDQWKARPATYAYARELFLSDYQAVGTSAGLKLVTNLDAVAEELPALDWRKAYSVVAGVSAGSRGTRDSELRTLLWGEKDGRKLAAPVIEIDHLRSDFVGGRWVMMNCDSGAVSGVLLSRLTGIAMEGASDVTVTPSYPLYIAGEMPAVDVAWRRLGKVVGKASIEIAVSSQGKQESEETLSVVGREFSSHTELKAAGAYAPGFHAVVATLTCDGKSCGIYRTGFWVRDEAYLLSGQRVTVDHDLFQLAGRKMPVVGTTYGDSKSQQPFSGYPNPYVWDQDMQQISGDGLNMLKMDWYMATGGTGVATEHTLRTMEGFLMTARRYNLPVQFNLSASIPGMFGGRNSYLYQEAVRREDAFVQSVVKRFHAVPFLIWNLRDEPSFDVVRNTGRDQLITVDRDESGRLRPLSPAFYAPSVDFTTSHRWRLHDDLLWESLVAKQKDKPMLVQETGVMSQANLLEQTVGIALGTGAGAIEGVWNGDSPLLSRQEATTSAVRWDGTEKPEVDVLRGYARWVAKARDQLRNAEPESVVILTSQGPQDSPLSSMATTAQQRAVRVMNYQCRMPARVISENNVADIAGSKLVVLPSPQTLSDGAWKKLLAYVEGGGNLLITGPMERDEHWQRIDRLRDLGLEGKAVALNERGSEIDLDGEKLHVGFSMDVRRHMEAIKLAGGRSYADVKRGSGRIFLVTVPVELAESPGSTEAVYRHVLVAAGVTAPFTAKASASMLVRARGFEASTLYLVVSESAKNEVVDLTDRSSGKELKISVPAQRTELILMDKVSGRVLASYGGPPEEDIE